MSPSRRERHTRPADYAALSALALAGALLGCGTDVAQTAVYAGGSKPPPLDCTPPSGSVTLPDDPRFGGDATLTDSPLATGDYGVDEGPGVSVVARDGFRLFANGALVATSTAALEPTFVPLTLLPGDNALALVVTAAERAPAALVQLDELERPYVSGVDWKVSMDPATDFASPSFKDADWDTALDLGTPAESPGCEPGSGFPRGSLAHFIGADAPGTAVFRLKLRIEPVGFGAGTTGGGTREPELAEDLDALVSALKSDDPKVVLVPEGTRMTGGEIDARRTGDDITDTEACPRACGGTSGQLTYNLLTGDDTCETSMVPRTRDERRIAVGSNTTLVGLGRGASLLGATLVVEDKQNVIVRNLVLHGVNPGLIEAGDGISLDGADGVWVDHSTFHFISDGFIDSTTGSQNLTFSWLKNDGKNPAACGGKHPRSNELSDTSATIHHTLWQYVDGRAPLATHALARVHLFDNVVQESASYAVGASCNAQVLLEATTFENVLAPTGKFGCLDADGIGLIHARGGHNVYGANVGKHRVGDADADEPNDSVDPLPYTVEVEDAATARSKVLERAGAGAHWALPLVEPDP